MRGKSPEESTAEFERVLPEIDHGVLLIIGVKQSQRGRGINLALAAKSYLAMIERGYKTASYTLMLDDNWASRRTCEKLGGYVARNFIIEPGGGVTRVPGLAEALRWPTTPLAPTSHRRCAH